MSQPRFTDRLHSFPQEERGSHALSEESKRSVVDSQHSVLYLTENKAAIAVISVIITHLKH